MNIVEKITILNRADGVSEIELLVTGKDDSTRPILLVGQVDSEVVLSSTFNRISLTVRPASDDMGLTEPEYPAYAG